MLREKHFNFMGRPPTPSILKYFIFTWPIVFLHWQLNDGICCLTQFEYWLDNKKNLPKINPSFIYFKNLLNIKMSNTLLLQLGCFFSTVTWSIGVYRYYK
jgi:hypothetical protein